MAQGSFSGQISKWVAETKERRDAVHRGSAQRIIAIMQTTRNQGGALRFDTGYLRSSLVVTNNSALPMATDKPDGIPAFTYDAAQTSLVILNADIKDPIQAVYSARYAIYREFGARGQPGDRWVALASQQWPQVVASECEKAKAAAGG